MPQFPSLAKFYKTFAHFVYLEMVSHETKSLTIPHSLNLNANKMFMFAIYKVTLLTSPQFSSVIKNLEKTLDKLKKKRKVPLCVEVFKPGFIC